MSDILHHITLLSGDLATHRIDTLDPKSVEACSALLPLGGQIPGFPAFRVEVVEGKMFTVWRGQEPLVSCGVGKSGVDSGTWNELAALQSKFGIVKAVEPKRGMWLAVVILPFFSMLAKDDAGWMADFERCLAAAMIANG